MRYLIISFISLSGILQLAKEYNPYTIWRFNREVKWGESAYADSNYVESIKYWESATSREMNPNLILSHDLGNAYFNNQDTSNAKRMYLIASKSKTAQNASLTHNQLGVLSAISQQKEEALEYFKNALRANSMNHNARFNYEVLKRMIEQEQQQQQPQQNKQNQEKNKNDKSSKDKKEDGKNGKDKEQGDGNNKDGQPESKNDKKDKRASGNESDEKDNIGKQMNQPDMEKMNQLGLNEKRAAQLLENLRSRENEFIQQQQKKITTKNKVKGNDW